MISGSTSATKTVDDLPVEIIDNILVRLPIKDAARTSILSSKWRFKWNAISSLRFTDECVSAPGDSAASYLLAKLVRNVDSVLTLHTGPILGFELSTKVLCFSLPDIDRWLIYLMRRGIKEITLRFLNGSPYPVSSHLFSCQKLRYLELYNCVINPRVNFQGFTVLSTLILEEVFDRNGAMENLLSNCPSLKTLSIHNCKGFTHCNIRAPNLERFTYSGNSVSLHFEPTTILAYADLSFSEAWKRVINHNRGVHHPYVTFACTENIMELYLSNYAIQYLRDYNLKKRHQSQNPHLKTLCMEVAFNNTLEVSTALSLLNSSPNLEVLNVKACSPDNQVAARTSFSFLKAPINFKLDFLQTVKLAKIIGLKQELRFIQIILTVAPVLRTMTVSMFPKDQVMEDSDIFKELMGFRRASPQAQILHSDKLWF